MSFSDAMDQNDCKQGTFYSFITLTPFVVFITRNGAMVFDLKYEDFGGFPYSSVNKWRSSSIYLLQK